MLFKRMKRTAPSVTWPDEWVAAYPYQNKSFFILSTWMARIGCSTIASALSIFSWPHQLIFSSRRVSLFLSFSIRLPSSVFFLLRLFFFIIRFLFCPLSLEEIDQSICSSLNHARLWLRVIRDRRKKIIKSNNNKQQHYTLAVLSLSDHSWHS